MAETDKKIEAMEQEVSEASANPASRRSEEKCCSGRTFTHR